MHCTMEFGFHLKSKECTFLTSLSKTSGLRTIHTSPTISGLKTVIIFLKNVKVFKMLKKDYQSYLCIFYSRYALQIHHYLR